MLGRKIVIAMALLLASPLYAIDDFRLEDKVQVKGEPERLGKIYALDRNGSPLIYVKWDDDLSVSRIDQGMLVNLTQAKHTNNGATIRMLDGVLMNDGYVGYVVELGADANREVFVQLNTTVRVVRKHDTGTLINLHQRKLGMNGEMNLARLAKIESLLCSEQFVQ